METRNGWRNPSAKESKRMQWKQTAQKGNIRCTGEEESSWRQSRTFEIAWNSWRPSASCTNCRAPSWISSSRLRGHPRWKQRWAKKWEGNRSRLRTGRLQQTIATHIAKQPCSTTGRSSEWVFRPSTSTERPPASRRATWLSGWFHWTTGQRCRDQRERPPSHVNTIASPRVIHPWVCTLALSRWKLSTLTTATIPPAKRTALCRALSEYWPKEHQSKKKNYRWKPG